MKASHSFIVISAALIISCTKASTCNADTVELKTGQRIDCLVKSVNSTEVSLEVAGQPLTIPRANVSAIYYGIQPTTAGPAAAMTSPIKDALRVLKSLQSATSVGISYRDYAPRVIDAKVQLDQLLSAAPDGPPKTALVQALEIYVYASNVWNAQITKSGYESIAQDPSLGRCSTLQSETERLSRPDHITSNMSDARRRGIALTVLGAAPIFSCASEAIATAEHLILGVPLVQADAPQVAPVRAPPVSETSAPKQFDDENDWDNACGAARNFCRDGMSMCDEYRREFQKKGRICHGVTDVAPRD
jgi:hypothetical protein